MSTSNDGFDNHSNSMPELLFLFHSQTHLSHKVLLLFSSINFHQNKATMFLEHYSKLDQGLPREKTADLKTGIKL